MCTACRIELHCACAVHEHSNVPPFSPVLWSFGNKGAGCEVGFLSLVSSDPGLINVNQVLRAQACTAVQLCRRS